MKINDDDNNIEHKDLNKEIFNENEIKSGII